MFENDVQLIIQSEYKHFTATERRLADYFLASPRDADLSAQMVAASTFVSMAALTRFAKKCGFAGYREFVYEYAIHNHTLANPDQVKQSVIGHYQQIISSSYQQIDQYRLQRVADLLMSSPRIFAYGIGSSGTAVLELKYRMMRIGISLDAMTDTQMMNMNINNFSKQTMLMYFSVSCNNTAAWHLRRAQEAGAKTVLVTANRTADAKQWADETLMIPYLRNLEIGNVISPILPMLLAIDLLYADVLLKAPERIKLLSHTVAPIYRKTTSTVDYLKRP